MILKIDRETVEQNIRDLISWDAFETSRVIMPDGSEDILIPYVMNDAVECIMRLQNGRHTKEGLRYSQAFLECTGYQYHRIGHSWRKQKGEEHLRRLVNLLCVVHDKHAYIGDAACNKEEEKLWPLIEYAPLCYWTPIDDSIESWYPETQTGIQAMLEFAIEAGDDVYADQVRDYMEISEDDPSKRWHVLWLAKALAHPDHAELFYHLDEQLTKASLLWEPRRYPLKKEHRMDRMREQMAEEWRKKGYEGTYPLLEKKKLPADGPHKVLFVEEHPFTVMEAADFDFKIHVIDCLP